MKDEGDMSGNKLKIACIGTGYWGKNLVRNFSELGALHALFDIDKNTLNKFKKKYPAARFADSYQDILKSNVDAVVIAVPAVLHYQYAREALIAGKDVFVEKPLALTVAEGRELVDLAETHKRILMVGHLLEYHPAVLKLEELIQKGELGKIQYIYSNRLNLGKFRTEENILWSFAPHDISVITLLLQERPTEVSAHGGNYLNDTIADVTVSNLSFASGVRAHIFVSWLHPFKDQKLVVVGNQKMAVFNDLLEKEKLLLYSHKINWVNRMPVPIKEEAEVVEFDPIEPLKAECQHFLDCIVHRQSPKTDGISGLRVLEVLTALQESLNKHGEPIPITKQAKPAFFVDKTAVIDSPCEIGEGTQIWHFSHVMKNARIGQRCIIGQNVMIGPDVVIGDHVKIQNNVSVYRGVTLEEGVFCGPSCVFTNVYNPRAFIERKHEFKPTLVKKGATIGANATILCGLTIGRYAVIGAGAVVKADVSDYAMVAGVPAKQIGWACECGVTLKFKGERATCDYCGKIYTLENGRILFDGEGKSSDAGADARSQARI